MSSWRRRDNGRYPVERNLPGSYTSSVSPTIMSRLYYGKWKIKVSGDFFSVAATRNMFFLFKAALLYLKVISAIVSKSIYWERRTKMSPN